VRLECRIIVAGFAPGAREGGARTAGGLNLHVSGRHSLRRIRGAARAEVDPKKCSALTDWRRDKAYGTILVDLEQHRPIDLLLWIEAETRAAWLSSHQAEIVSRDRSQVLCGEITERAGAPRSNNASVSIR